MDLADALRVFRRRWAALALCIVIGVLGGLATTAASPRTYRASARLFVNLPTAGGVQESLEGVRLTGSLLGSYSRLISSRTVGAAVSAKLDRRFTIGQVRQRLRAVPERGTLIIHVSATDSRPGAARDLANAGAEAFTEMIAELEANKTDPIEARLIDPAGLPQVPISPVPRRDLTFGLLFGLAGGVGLVFVLEALDRSITTAEQASKGFGAPTLGNLPRQRRMDKDPLVALEGTASHGSEAYRALRTSVRFLDRGEPLRTIVVSSASQGEGKTTVAANLAIAIAQAGERVIIVDADLRRPRLAGLFGMEGQPGLTDVVHGQMTLGQALRPWSDSLAVLPGGAPPSNPSEVLGSELMASLIQQASRMADVVIFDTPPILPVTDAAVLSALTDGVIVVARWASTTIDAAEEARFTLEGVGARVAGVVINAVKAVRVPSYYQEYQRTPLRAPERR